ncbi:MAG: nitroreductase family deazaflavin-dependent oxidoreductase [Streptomycetaceae bacterium]|nr:nitroreductase family deazaflavin-dependent oxidoreductase [Streptomycetaceae bacterium]
MTTQTETAQARPHSPTRYIEAGRVSSQFNRAVRWITAHGVSIAGSRLLAVRGRKSGEWRTNPVNPLTHEGERYLVAPRGNTHWVRNLRATDGGELRLGKRTEAFGYVELTDAEKPEVLRAYLKRWKWEVGIFFDGVDANATDEELLRIAPGHPVFRILPRP